jgi:mandelate racemase
MALSAIDIALWDALAVARQEPLGDVLGGTRRPINAYDSRGLGLMAPERLRDEGSGSSRQRPEGHQAAPWPWVSSRRCSGSSGRPSQCAGRHRDHGRLQSGSDQADAIARGRAIEQEGITWLEEPIRHDDYTGNAAVAAALAVPLQIGENFNGPAAVTDALAVDACDLIMPDAGVSVG